MPFERFSPEKIMYAPDDKSGTDTEELRRDPELNVDTPTWRAKLERGHLFPTTYDKVYQKVIGRGEEPISTEAVLKRHGFAITAVAEDGKYFEIIPPHGYMLTKDGNSFMYRYKNLGSSEMLCFATKPNENTGNEAHTYFSFFPAPSLAERYDSQQLNPERSSS